VPVADLLAVPKQAPVRKRRSRHPMK
jgi:hypothetical protein